MKTPVAAREVPDENDGNRSHNQSSESIAHKKNGLTYEAPASLMDEIGQRLGVNIRLKEMSNMCYILLKRDLFIDTMVNFLTVVDHLDGMYFTFSTFSNKGVLRFTGISAMSFLKEEQWCLSSMMKLFGGYMLSDHSSLTLVFQMKSKFAWS